MNNNGLKGIKQIVNFTILALTFAIGCAPIGVIGLPILMTQSASPNPRADLCNLLLSVGGTAADVETCLVAVTITQEDIERLCAASAGLTDSQKETLRAGLTSSGIDANTCENLPKSTASPVSSPTPETSPSPSSTGIVTQINSPASPAVSSSPTNASIIETSPTPTSTAMVGHRTDDSNSNPDEENPSLDVTVEEPTPIPDDVSAE